MQRCSQVNGSDDEVLNMEFAHRVLAHVDRAVSATQGPGGYDFFKGSARDVAAKLSQRMMQTQRWQQVVISGVEDGCSRYSHTQKWFADAVAKTRIFETEWS